MRIIIAGGTGFIGQYLVQHFRNAENEIIVIGRTKNKIRQIFHDKVGACDWHELESSGLQLIKSADCIINLNGASIGNKRWSDARKKVLVDSRVKYTKILAKLCAKLGKDSPPLINANGVGIYGLQAGLKESLPESFDEQSLINCANPKEFLVQISCEWEHATTAASEAGVRVVILRSGVVLNKSGGVLAKFLLPFKLGLGGPIGSGTQPFSWVSLEDYARSVEFLIDHPNISGPVNIVAPTCVTQREFANALAKSLNRPAIFPMPAFLVKIIFGEMGEELLLNGQHVVPKILIDAGFKFNQANLDQLL